MDDRVRDNRSAPADRTVDMGAQGHISDSQRAVPRAGRRTGPIRICYLILLHHKLEQARRLLARLAGADTAFVLHLDRSVPRAAVAKFRSALPGSCPIAFAPRVRSRWGTYDGARAAIHCIQTALQSEPFDRYILLSGQDYPIANRAQIAEFFRSHRELEYLEAFPRDVTVESTEPGWSAHYRFSRYHVWIGKHRRVLPLIRKRPPTIPVCHGATWWALTHPAVSFIAREFETNHALRRYFKSGFLVDEAYIPTLMRSSPFAAHIVGSNLTYAQWTSTSGPHPKVLTTADWGSLLAAPQLFARKFDSTVDEALMDMLDALHGEPALAGTAGDRPPLSVARALARPTTEAARA